MPSNISEFSVVAHKGEQRELISLKQKSNGDISIVINDVVFHLVYFRKTDISIMSTIIHQTCFLYSGRFGNS